ncbi:MAG: 30S ribosomal protein S4 [bacterium]|nr:30S ribosomal protein S4 [bacterium]
MSRYTGPKCRLCRREGEKLFLKGPRCQTEKCAFERRQTTPGLPPKKNVRRLSEYGIHLREKQKVKRMYGLQERQFREYFEVAASKKGVTGEALLQMLERRLDNLVYRIGLASSRRMAREYITHGHFLVNNHITNVPSFLVKKGDEIKLKEKSKTLKSIEEALKGKQEVPLWLSFEPAEFRVVVKELPERKDAPQDIRENLIVELYSK